VVSGRGDGALLAWKLGSRCWVTDEVVVPGSGVVGDSSGGYRRIRGGNKHSKYTANIANKYMA
jgi:hypothetical protein